MADSTQSPSMSPLGEFGNETAAGVIDTTKDLGNELIAAVRDNATALLDEQRDRAATEIAAAGDLLRHSAQSLDQKSGVVARAANDMAMQIDDLASWLRNRSWGELAEDVEGFARRNPMLFVGVAAALGFLACRFVTVPATGLREVAGSTPINAGGASAGQARMVSSAVASGEFH